MSLLENDMVWMWEQLRSTSKLPDPRTSYGHWLNLIQRSPKFWKRLVRRASEHCILQRCRFFRARGFHRQVLERLWSMMPPIVDRPIRLQAPAKEAFGCIGCGKRCKNYAGEAVHMYEVHGVASLLRKLADQPTCAACRRFFHTMQKLQATCTTAGDGVKPCKTNYWPATVSQAQGLQKILHVRNCTTDNCRLYVVKDHYRHLLLTEFSWTMMRACTTLLWMK